MASYSIRDLEAITGVRTHTIRMWEQRYHILSPERTSTNIRQYSESNLRVLTFLAFLIRQGLKISQLSGLSEDALREQARRYLDMRNENETKDIELLRVIAIQMDEHKFEKFFSTVILQRGIQRAIVEVLYPFTEHIRLFWSTEPHLLGMEAFLTSLIRRKIQVAIETLAPPPNKKEKTFLLFLPEKHLGELSLLFCQYEFRSKGHRVFYLGCELPVDAVAHVAAQVQADELVCAMSLCHQNLTEYISKLLENINREKQHISILGPDAGKSLVGHLPVNYFTALANMKKQFGL
jgi:DNA-binding transcriptional MerR regulator